MKSVDVEKALAWHRSSDSKTFAKTREGVVDALFAIVKKSLVEDPTVRDGIAAADRLSKMLGWDAPKKVVTTDTGPYFQEVLTAVASGDESAALALAKMEEETILEVWKAWKAGEFSGGKWSA